jgi:hypothetical protein
MELPLTEVGATNFGQPYKPGIYTPRLGLTPFRHITNMVRPLMDSVNTAIRCPYSTGSLPELRLARLNTNFTKVLPGVVTGTGEYGCIAVYSNVA